MSTPRKIRGSRLRSKSPGAVNRKQQPGLRGTVQKRILDDVFSAAANKDPSWKILIVDDHAMKVVSAAVGMYDIMEKRITLVESIDKKRAPFKDLSAIYLLEPSQESIDKLIKDWDAKDKIKYGSAVFLFFTRRLSDELLNQIKSTKYLVKRLRALVEVNVDFLTNEERAFSLDMPDAFSNVYLRRSARPIELSIAEKMVTVCATMNEYPHIRYKKSSGCASSLANIFNIKMEEFIANNPKWTYRGQGRGQSESERATLILLDRADDCLTPLMHDFHYQPMVHDLLKMTGDRITYQSETAEDPNKLEDKDVLLDERDNLWVELRGKHIAAVIETLSERIREITSSATGSALSSKKNQGNMSLSQMAAAMKALPEYREVMSKLSQHMHLSHECMSVFREESLLDLGELEQTLATGKDESGKSPMLNGLIDQAERMLMRMKSSTDRLRLILILTISQGGLTQQDRRRVMNAAELSRQDVKTLNALEIMGLPIFSSGEKGGRIASIFGSGRSAGAYQSDDEGEYAGARYVPPLKTILEGIMDSTLDFDEYPSVLPMPEASVASSAKKSSARSARSSARGSVSSARKGGGATSRWAKSDTAKRSTGPTNFAGGRTLVFTLGGLSYTELKAARAVMEKKSREVIIGSTHFVSPADFMTDLDQLAKDGD